MCFVMNQPPAVEVEAVMVGELIQPAADILDSSSNSSSTDNSSDSTSSNSSAISLDSGDDSDEEQALMFAAYEELLFGAPQVRVENYLQTVEAKSDEQFRREFRLQRNVAYALIDELAESGFIPEDPAGGGKPRKSAEFSFLLYLWFVSNDDVHMEVANLFGCGITTVYRVVRRVTDWILTIMDNHIVWPRGEGVGRVSEDFSQKAGIQNCIGAIDGSHIFIEKPIQYGRVYYCRKERYSIILQAVVDAKMLFTNVSCGNPGSYHDTRVLRGSPLYNLAENQLEHVFPNGAFLLGDKGYVGVGTRWIVTPFKDYHNLTDDQEEFNTRVSCSRVVVEQAFGILKARFRYLRGIMRLRDIRFAARLVIACCVLHNVCMRAGDIADDLIDADHDDADDNADDNGNVGVHGNDGNVIMGNVDDDLSDHSDNDDGNEGADGHRGNDAAGIRTHALFRAMYPGAVIPGRVRRGLAGNQ